MIDLPPPPPSPSPIRQSAIGEVRVAAAIPDRREIIDACPQPLLRGAGGLCVGSRHRAVLPPSARAPPFNMSPEPEEDEESPSFPPRPPPHDDRHDDDEDDDDTHEGNMTQGKIDRASSEEKPPANGAASSKQPSSSAKGSAKDPNRPRRKKARRACFACQRAHLTCGKKRIDLA